MWRHTRLDGDNGLHGYETGCCGDVAAGWWRAEFGKRSQSICQMPEYYEITAGIIRCRDSSGLGPKYCTWD
jgi:hypothetical protein